ncbi:MAG TPA: benzoylsuccinyl-CoA thiolase [Deltaproteobacteria bacterium]|nr:benzoylsuccinyl-CoA thiolase [Deltaproteobacteria bacterium]
MSTRKNRVPAIEGWIKMDEDDPHLLGYLDATSGTYFFPKDVSISRAPGHADAELTEVELSNRGRLWSYTTNHYQPPEPYVAPDPFVPYTVAAVELTKERMIVLGQLADGVDPETIEVGQEMELVLGTLYEDEENEYIVWKWKPVAA